MAEELFEVIGESGKVIGREQRSVVHARGLRHRASDLIIRDDRGRVFIQQRAKDKDFAPSLWDFSVAEHLQPGESWERAARRGAAEELGIKVRNLKLLGEIDFHFKYPGGEIDNESNRVFTAEFEGEMRFKDMEVQRGKFISLRELLREMGEKPENFTPWFLQGRKLLEKIATQ